MSAFTTGTFNFLFSLAHPDLVVVFIRTFESVEETSKCDRSK